MVRHADGGLTVRGAAGVPRCRPFEIECVLDGLRGGEFAEPVLLAS